MKKRMLALICIAGLLLSLTACKPAHTHTYTQQITKATCQESGYTYFVCDCGDNRQGDVLPVDENHHIDEDQDLVCDFCQVSVIVELDFYSVNDLHGAFLDTDTHPGVDEFTTYMKEKYADDSAYEILLSAGDMWQGSVESSTNKGKLMTRWMNELDFVAMTIGNHEYDWGSDYISQNRDLAEFPFLGINIREGGIQPDYCKNSVTVERGGVKIGIIGAMGNHLSSISGEFTDGLDFLTGRTLTQLVKDEADRLRLFEGCDLVVYVMHNDDAGYDVSLSDGYVDLVFEGHTHKSYIDEDFYGVTHIQSGSYNEAVSFVNIAYNLAEDTYQIEEKKNLSADHYGDPAIADDPCVESIFKTYFPEEDPYTTVLGTTATDRTAKEICQELANQYLQFGQSHWSQYDIVLAGGHLKLRDPNKLFAGDVTYAQLFTLMPFDNRLVVGQISGANLKSKFINNNSYYKAISDTMPEKIDDNATYYIVVDTYTAYYETNGITVVETFGYYYARDIIADFIKAGNWNY